MRTTLIAAAVTHIGLLASIAAAEVQSDGSKFAIAIERGDLAAVQALVAGGASPDTSIEYGAHVITPLAKAAWDGRADIARYLLSKGAKVDAAAADSGETPLIQAAVRGWDDVVEILLKAGANPRATDRRGDSPLSSALFNAHLDVADQLIQAGADVNEAGAYGITALKTAASVCKPEVIRFLVSKGADVDEVGRIAGGGDTPLVAAARSGHAEWVRALLDLGANPALKMKDGSTALAKAEAAGKTEAADLIRAALARPMPKRPAPAAKRK